MRIITLCLALLALALPASGAMAVPINYNLSILFSSCTADPFGENARECAASDPVFAGMGYSGTFSIDDSVLQTDGYSNAGFQSFFLQLGDYVWDSLNPRPGSDYSGSRFFNPDTKEGGFGPWTLQVENGELVGICCGVFGSADVPFVDLYSFSPFGVQRPPNFVSVLAVAGGPNRFNFSAQGIFGLQRVAAPGTLALFGAGMLGMALWSRRRRVNPG